MKIVDCFTFFNETDLLEFRLKLLSPYVDHFVIAESNISHAGKPKEYNFEKNRERYAVWKDKIIYLPIEQSTTGLTFDDNPKAYDPTNGSWQLEMAQRNALQAARRILADEDMVIIGDLDEVPDPAIFKRIDLHNSPLTVSMIFHNYFMNCQNVKAERWWNGSIICSGKDFKTYNPQHFRDKRHDYTKIKQGGWHFSYLGGIEKIKYKLQSFAHTEFNKPEYLDDEHIIHALENGLDVLKRPGIKYKFVPLDFYPKYVSELMQQYPVFIKPVLHKKSWLDIFR